MLFPSLIPNTTQPLPQGTFASLEDYELAKVALAAATSPPLSYSCPKCQQWSYDLSDLSKHTCKE